MDPLALAVDQFNAGEFYACHDTLEALWIESLDPERKFLQGLLQTAVAYYHLSHGNWRGGVILLGESIAKLQHFCPEQSGLDIESLVETNRANLRTLQHLGPEGVAAIGSPQIRWI